MFLLAVAGPNVVAAVGLTLAAAGLEWQHAVSWGTASTGPVGVCFGMSGRLGLQERFVCRQGPAQEEQYGKGGEDSGGSHFFPRHDWEWNRRWSLGLVGGWRGGRGEQGGRPPRNHAARIRRRQTARLRFRHIWSIWTGRRRCKGETSNSLRKRQGLPMALSFRSHSAPQRGTGAGILCGAIPQDGRFDLE